MVTPNLGRSVQLSRLEEEFRTAKSTSIEELARWASQHLNIEIGLGLRTDRWRGADHWLAATEPGLTLEGILSRCEVATVGIDGGGLDDLLGLSVIGRELGGRRWLHWGRAWADRGVLELRKSEASTLLGFEEDGDLVFVDDMEEAFAEAADLVAQVKEAGLLSQVGLDPMGVGAVVDALAVREVAGDKTVVGISQGWTLNGAIKTTEIKLKSRALVHCGQRLLAWAVGNAKVEPKGNAVTITKAIAGAGKIDPLMATLNAVALMSRNPVATVGAWEAAGTGVW
jgi:phage terminase large subunit-like protein